MASVIKSLGVGDAAFSLASGAQRVVGVASTINSTAGSLSAELPGEVSLPQRQAEEVSAADKAAKAIEETVRKRVEEAVAQQGRELREKHLAAEASLFEAVSDRGYQEGLRLAAEELSAHKEALAKQLSLLDENIVAALSAAFENVTEIASEIAFEAVLKLLGREIATGDAVAALTREVAIRSDVIGEVVLRVNPKDAELLSTRSEAVIPSRYRIEADDSLTQGGCVIETSRGIVDARLETRLEAFLVALRGSPSEHPESLQ